MRLPSYCRIAPDTCPDRSRMTDKRILNFKKPAHRHGCGVSALFKRKEFRNYNLPTDRSITFESLCFALETRVSAINTSLIEARLAIFSRSSSFSLRSIRFFWFCRIKELSGNMLFVLWCYLTISLATKWLQTPALSPRCYCPCVRWYLVYALSLRNLEEMIAVRGVVVELVIFEIHRTVGP